MRLTKAVAEDDAFYISIHAPLAGCDAHIDGVADRDLISIHAPLAGCDVMTGSICAPVRAFQSTHPLRGATAYPCIDRADQTHFNPRTPCGVRPVVDGGKLYYNGISIHAPLAGCDLGYSARHDAWNAFQSTHPLRGATVCLPRAPVQLQFQSTHPLRGATSCAARLAARSTISIHAPLAGCDDRSQAPVLYWRRFQSTHPLRGATARCRGCLIILNISIHAPLAGCDLKLKYQSVLRIISIHAPLAGCDTRAHLCDRRLSHFNPRTPCGVRRGIAGPSRSI